MPKLTTVSRKLSNVLYQRRNLTLLLMLTPPLLWFGVVYVGSLLTLLGQSIFTFDDMAMSVVAELTADNFRNLMVPANLDIVLRTLGMALAVTLGTTLIGFPMAYYMAHYATPTEKGFFFVGVMLPMWASYIVKAYAWTVLLAKGGVMYWTLEGLGLIGVLEAVLRLPGIGGDTLATSNIGRFLVFTYIWLPFMILPIQAAIERVPANLLLASADLGARPFQTFRTVLWPLAFPGVVAGSIFTFSLTLGDYIIPQLVGPPGLYIGSMVYTLQGTIGNMPMAAAFTCVPIILITVYLALARRLGAFNAL
ncbi:MAG: ABC transporter permease [Rhodoferax sp.]|uniref:ABC transporter permease n=1 Tax=Rhodoferax sp. TaxID=50421 RepID=UPI0008D1295B|nr:ABC transporter permease [Rhodoferax sp.]MDP2679207.1 ABC transporter permease [Rhodoferax sp.]OGB81388.1 MAG: spermidine/putrescine ABC transporter permease [Burkholderiales bacterium RIFOXYC12_FULL_60_6]